MDTVVTRTRRAALHRTTRVSWLLLIFGVASASFSAILVRYADGAGPLAISFWRCAAGAVVLAPLAARRLASMTPRAWVVCSVAGAFLALHFATWVTSLTLTSVASAVVLVTAGPIFVAALDRVFFGRRLSASGWTGICISLAGTVLIVGGDFHGNSQLGDGLALAGGFAVAVYTLAGREARRDLGIFEYAAVTYAVAAVCLLVACVVSGESLSGYDATTWWAIAGLIVGPQLLGHTVINLVLKDLDATTVSVTIMTEPVIATALALVLFSEIPTAWFYPGALAVLAGIYVVAKATHVRPEVLE